MAPIPELEKIRKSQILQAALSTISARGGASATMEEVASAAGLSKGGLAHYFKSKDALFSAAFSEFFDRVFVRCREGMDKAEGPLEKLLSFEVLYDRNDPDISTGYPILFDFMSAAVRDSDYRALFREWVDRWIELLCEALEMGVAQGLWGGFDLAPMARSISAVYQGVATRWYLAPEDHGSDWAMNTVRDAVAGLLVPYMKTKV